MFVALRARLVEVLDEAAERVARDELLAHQLEARRGRGVVGLEPLLDGAALVRMAVGLLRDGGGAMSAQGRPQSSVGGDRRLSRAES